jgi:hypothetical protein
MERIQSEACYGWETHKRTHTCARTHAHTPHALPRSLFHTHRENTHTHTHSRGCCSAASSYFIIIVVIIIIIIITYCYYNNTPGDAVQRRLPPPAPGPACGSGGRLYCYLTIIWIIISYDIFNYVMLRRLFPPVLWCHCLVINCILLYHYRI